VHTTIRSKKITTNNELYNYIRIEIEPPRTKCLFCRKCNFPWTMENSQIAQTEHSMEQMHILFFIADLLQNYIMVRRRDMLKGLSSSLSALSLILSSDSCLTLGIEIETQLGKFVRAPGGIWLERPLIFHNPLSSLYFY